jgi:hypothetical protein
VRVESVDAIAVEIPLTRNFGGSTYSVLKRSTVVTYLRTDAGLLSEVYNGDNREHGAEIVRLIREDLGPRLRGVEVLAIEQTWDDLFTLSHASRDRNTLLEAIACVDCALWDVIGKACSLTVAELLGGKPRALPIISIGGYYMPGKTLADIGREMEAYRRAGMAGCKFKVGGLTPEADAERVEVARDAAGDDFVLASTPTRWSVGDAVRFAKLVEPPRHPLVRALSLARRRRDDGRRPAGHAHPGHRRSVGDHRPGLGASEAGAVDIVNVDASECGGVTEWRRAPPSARRGRDGAPRRVTDRPPSDGGGAAWDLRGVLRRSRARSGVAEHVGQPSAHQGRHARGLVGCGVRSGPRRGHGAALPRRVGAVPPHDRLAPGAAWTAAARIGFAQPGARASAHDSTTLPATMWRISSGDGATPARGSASALLS